MISKEDLNKLREDYPIGCKVKLISMNDRFAPPVGTIGTVKGVDDIGTIHVDWQTGSSLGVLFMQDSCVKIN